MAASHRWPLPALARQGLIDPGAYAKLPAAGDQPALAWPTRIPLTGLIDHQVSLASLVLGVTVTEAGTEVITGDMAHLVHVAVGGSSGYGKSQFLRTLAYQMITAAEQPDVVVVDLERVTFSPFEQSSRLLYPIADTEQDALAVFTDLVAEIDRRKAAFARYPGVDSLGAYNQVAGELLRPICILVDEGTALLGDKDVESACRTIALRARKYGLWLVLGGQDWKASSLDTAIRNQLSARVQFKALSASQSRVLLERTGAEELDVPGRALAILPGRGLIKLQTPFVSPAEIGAVVTGGGPRGAIPAAAEGPDLVEIRVRELASRGLSRRQIELEIFGYAGGQAHQQVNHILGATTTTDHPLQAPVAPSL
jgi:DNA segregation ATPase FtsK/SpoIIIE-like protein